MIRIKLFRLTNCKKKDIGWQKMAEDGRRAAKFCSRPAIRSRWEQY